MVDLGDITRVWTPAAFALAFLAGFVFGLVLGRFARRMRRQSADAQTAGWFAGALSGWFVTLFVVSQSLAGIIDGDAQWPRILSRLGPELVGAAAAGIGTWAALRWSRRKA